MLILAAMLLFVVPQFETIYASLGGQLPLRRRILLGVSNAVRNYWYIVVLGCGGRVVPASGATRRPTPGGLAWDAVKLKRPGLRPAVPQDRAGPLRLDARRCCCASGVPILQALDIVAETVNNRVIGDAVDDVKTSVREGESIAKPLGQAQGVPADGRPDDGGR